MKILIVEDEISLLHSISQYLENSGNICAEASDYFEAEDKLLVHSYDIVVLDILLPDGNGLGLLKRLKADHPQTGILIVSAKNSLEDKLNGLDLGADDYIAKPFHLAELHSRINAIIRRKDYGGKATLEFNEITIDTEAKQVAVYGKPINLTNKEYELMLYFITNKDRVVTKESIAEYLWGDHSDMMDNFDFVYTHIRNLRKKIMAAGSIDYLENIYGIGYKYTDK
ncbi:MAG: response regulator transcription factor [Bacteroidales bacterium]|nr:response regulator transcription factor [Bacteroidales bacterium]MCF8336684.1 response regulator transcription factor [Bacteroidales bacterium]